MPYIGFGLVTIIVGLLLFLGSDSPGTLARSERSDCSCWWAAWSRCLIGIVTHVSSGQSRRPASPVIL